MAVIVVVAVAPRGAEGSGFLTPAIAAKGLGSYFGGGSKRGQGLPSPEAEFKHRAILGETYECD